MRLLLATLCLFTLATSASAEVWTLTLPDKRPQHRGP